jgi:hypothetical protein
VADLEAKLAQAEEIGLQHLVLYRTATGAWDCTARSHGKLHTTVGHSVLRTSEAALTRALDEYLSRMTADKEDPFA